MGANDSIDDLDKSSISLRILVRFYLCVDIFVHVAHSVARLSIMGKVISDKDLDKAA